MGVCVYMCVNNNMLNYIKIIYVLCCISTNVGKSVILIENFDLLDINIINIFTY